MIYSVDRRVQLHRRSELRDILAQPWKLDKMKTTGRLIISVGIVASLAILSGWLHGSMSNRWGARPDELAAASLLEKTPLQVGTWHSEQSFELAEGVVRMLQCSGDINRLYANSISGQQVNVAVLLGPPGPIAAHTPEICYSSVDYTQQGTRRLVSLEIGGTKHSFWQVMFKRNSVDGELLSVFYAWSSGDEWMAVDEPRWEFADKTFLYKIQLASILQPLSNAEDHQPCSDFLTEFVPVVDEYLTSPKR